MRTHHFQPDHENGPDHRGDYRCICGMPEKHGSHDVPEPPVGDVSDRIIGEGEAVET
jgi:hypothetical protein